MARKKRNIGQEMVEGMRHILADVRGERPFKGRAHVVYVVDLKALRKKLGVSQAQFAKKFGFNRRTLQDWEQGRAAPDQSNRAYLRVIARNPKAVEKALAG